MPQKKSVWRRLSDAYEQDRGVRLTAEETCELVNAIAETLNNQLHYETAAKNSD